MSELTVEEARRLLSYDAETGVLSWAQRKSGVRPFARFGRLCADGYRDGQLNRVHYMEHRLIWFLVHGEWPPDEIDHINGNRSDNRLCNLRLATRRQNAANRAGSSKSGRLGVTWNAAAGRWQAHLRSGGKTHYLGLFDSVDEAGAVRDAFAAEVQGAFARTLNAPKP